MPRPDFPPFINASFKSKRRRTTKSLPTEMRIVEASARLLVQAAADKPTTFSGVCYSGGPLFVEGFNGLPVYVDLRGMRIVSAEAPVYRQHDDERAIGHTTVVAIEGNQVRIEGKISRTGPHVDEVIEGAKAGYPWQPSIGTTIDAPPEFIKAGQSATVNGRTFSGPAYVARKTTYRETSFVDLGGDAEAQITLAAKFAASTTPNGDSPMTFEEWIASCGLDAAALTPESTAALQTVFDSLQADSKPTAEAVAAALKKLGGVQHANNVAELTASLKKTFDAQVAEMQKNILATLAVERETTLLQAQLAQHPDLAKQATDLKWGPTEIKAALKVAEIRAARQTGPYIAMGGPAESTPQILEAALCVTAKLPNVEKRFDEKTLEAAHKHHRRLSIGGLLLTAAAANGYSLCGKGTEIQSDLPGVLKAAFSTTALSNILENVANKFLLDRYMSGDQAWRKIARIRPVKDFKPTKSYRLTSTGTWTEVGTDGQLKHGTLGDQAFSNQAKTYGQMLVIPRQDIINDDLGALSEAPALLGDGAIDKLNLVFWTAWLADSAFFNTDNSKKNYFSGAATNLQGSSLTTAVTKFRQQVKPNNHPIGTTPELLLVPSALDDAATTLMTSDWIVTGENATKPNNNAWKSKFEPVVAPYLDDPTLAIPGYSATAWYLLADPQKISGIDVCFLDGNETPTIEQAEADFSTLGIQMRAFHDFGVTLQDYRCGVKSKGAA